MISAASLSFLVLICSSGYFLYNSPSVGISAVWDKSARMWRVDSAEPWSLLQVGDLIQRIGGVDIGPLHLCGCIKNLRDRDEVLAWSEARTRLYRELKDREVPFTVIRGSQETTVVLSPKAAEWSFLFGYEYLPFLSGLFCFAVATVVLYKKGLDEQSVTLFLLCSCFFISGICFPASSSPELVLEPWFDFLDNQMIALGNPLAAVLILHVSLILPTRKKILERVPKLLLPVYVIAFLIGLSLDPRAINSTMAVCISLGLLVLAHSFFTCGKPIEREQMKWMAAGFVLGFIPFLVLSLIPMALTGQELVSVRVTFHMFCLLLLSIALAIQKYRLMEIDAFLEGTFVYVVTFTLLGAIDLSLMGFFSSRFAHALELRPTGRVFVSIVITLSVYAAIRDKIRMYIRKLLGREPMNEQDILLAFTQAASGNPPASILKLFASCIKDGFKPKCVTLVEKGSGENEEILSAFKGLTAPVPLWQSPLQRKVPEGSTYYLALPIARDGETECVVLLGELPGGRLYSTRELGILSSLLREARLLYDNACLYDENLRHCRLMIEEEKRHLREKEKIVRELHDGLGGITTNINLLSEVAVKASSPTKKTRNLSAIVDLSREGLAEIRTFMRSLEDENLTWPGLVTDLKSYGAKIIEPNGMAFELESVLAHGIGRPGSYLFLNISRIYREALTNVVKHSGATLVRVLLEVSLEKVLLTVEDNGAGFDPDQARKGRGLSHMRKRAADIGGTVSIQSDKGTRVRLEVSQ